MAPLNARLMLMYSGIIPFIGISLLMVSGLQIAYVQVSNEIFLSSYTLLIGSFMAGVHWGQGLDGNDSNFAALSLLSNLVTLAFWGAFLFLPYAIFLTTAALLFALLLLIDVILYRSDRLCPRYFRHRLIVTSCVMGALFVAAGH